MYYQKADREMDNRQVSTEELLGLLFKESDPGRFFQQNEPAFLTISFGEYMSLWCKKHDKVPEHIIRRANLDKSYGHQLFSGKRNPSRDTVLQLAIAMGAGYEQTQEMLRIAGKSQLYPRIKRDAAIIYCINNNKPLTDIQILLEELELPLLGGRKDERT